MGHAATNPGAVVSPMGVVHQESIDEQEHPVPKDHTMHDQSFSPVTGTKHSVNDWCQIEYAGDPKGLQANEKVVNEALKNHTRMYVERE